MIRYLQILFLSSVLMMGVIYGGKTQSLESFGFKFTNGLELGSIRLSISEDILFIPPSSLFSVEVNGQYISSKDVKALLDENQIRLMFPNGLTGSLKSYGNGEKGWKGILKLRNRSPDTLIVENVVPFGATDDHVYLTSEGPWSLTRANLYLPDKNPISVILPDNAWEMGYGAKQLDENYSVAAICRRTGKENADLKRYKTVLPPNSEVEYTFYADVFSGEWQEGLKMMFQDRYLFDLEEFNNTLYDRKDLNWIKNKYIITLQFAWDQQFYNSDTKKFSLYTYLEDGQKKFGGYDVYGIWPTWPRLGVDQRNQWELYEDLPYGLPKLKELSGYCKANGTRFFISYNPWDQSTDEQDPYKSMASLIKNIDADGVVLDTRGSSSFKLQNAADSVKQGVVMYSEGMAITKDMPGILSGRVHNAISRSPILNLNKLIKPDFAIFRVCVLNRGRIHRDLAISFFNGYGTEINTFDPGRPDWLEEEYLYLGKTTRILRENSSVFLNTDWVPLIPTLQDNVYVNKWRKGSKSIFTVLSMNPEGATTPMFEVNNSGDFHFVSLWHHRELNPVQIDGKSYIQVDVREFNKKWLGTNREGNLDCIAGLPNLLNLELKGDSLKILASDGNLIKIWSGNPSYQNTAKEYTENQFRVKLAELFNKNEGKFVVQLFKDDELLDERVVNVEPGKPYLISSVKQTKKYKNSPAGMKIVPGADFSFEVTNPDQFIPYPDYSIPQTVKVDSFYMDEYPVTNKDFYDFLEATHYIPQNSVNFLKHWENGIYPQGQENYPVVYINIEDAKAYADWVGKRLPTEVEWQYAAQGTDGRLWPWGVEYHGTRCNNAFGKPTPVDAFPKGNSPFEIADMVGNIWQLTNDIYFNGSYKFIIIRGGSYFNPTSSSWYVKGGPQPLNRTQMLLLVTPGFDRNATVGFRCVADVE